VNAALESGVEFEALYVDESALHDVTLSPTLRRAQVAGVRVFSLADGVIAKIADAQNPQPLLGSVRMPTTRIDDVEPQGLIVILHDVRDPGNAGTIVRSADAGGAHAVVFTGQSVDPFNPKTLRSTAGSIFHLPIVVCSIDEVLDHFSHADVQVLATVVRGARSHRVVDYSVPTLVVIGNEASGLDDETVARCDGTITIPMVGASESLNAATAASLVIFEALYQREDAKPGPPPRSLEEL
jgi:TrmH family RNA methyltransferase